MAIARNEAIHLKRKDNHDRAGRHSERKSGKQSGSEGEGFASLIPFPKQPLYLLHDPAAVM
jgi:hypothetical protein